MSLPVSPRLLVIRMLALGAIAASTALLVDHLRPHPAFCGFHSGCETVLLSPYSSVLRVPVPVIGLIAFGTLLAVSFFPADGLGRWLTPLAMIGGIAGLGLVVFQAVLLHTFCSLCLIVDSLALATAAVAIGWQPPAQGEADHSPRWLWLLLLLLVIAGPLAWGLYQPAPEIPDFVKQLQVPGKINVIAYTDFGCPRCRLTHAAMKKMMQKHGDLIHLVVIPTPTPTEKHSHAAALAYYCVRAQDPALAERMAELLWVTDNKPDENECLRLAKEVGVDVKKLEECVTSGACAAQVETNIAQAKSTGATGVPIIFINDEMLFGEQSAAVFQAAFERAKRRLALKSN